MKVVISNKLQQGAVTKNVETVVSLAISKFLISTFPRASEAKILHLEQKTAKCPTYKRLD